MIAAHRVSFQLGLVFLSLSTNFLSKKLMDTKNYSLIASLDLWIVTELSYQNVEEYC